MYNRSGGDNPSDKADFPIAVRQRQTRPEGIRQPQEEHFLHLTERVPDIPGRKCMVARRLRLIYGIQFQNKAVRGNNQGHIRNVF